MNVIIQLLWAATVLVFLAGAVTYAFNSHLGLTLLKRSLVLLGVILIGPSLLSTVFNGIPAPLLVLIGLGISVGAYSYVTARAPKHQGHSSSSHAERKPKLPH